MAAVNDAPAITAASLAVAEGGTVLITPANIGVSDPDSSSFAFTVSNVTHGSFQTTTDGVTWTNATSFTTADLAASHVRFVHDGSLTAPTFSIQANDGAALNNLSNVFVGTVSFNNVNHAPVATPVTLAAGTEDTAYTITAATLLAGVTDVDGPSLSITSVSVASGGGSLVNNGNGTWTYTPAANVSGAVSFNYTAFDGSLSASSTASLTLAPVNDAPVAVADTLSATEDTAVTYTAAQLLGNDTDVDNSNAQLSIASVTSGTGGTAVLNANGTVTFTPNANFSGAASFTYTVSDGASTSSPATVTVNVAAVNDAPVAVADTLSATEDTAVTYTAAQLLGNDTDVDNSNAQLSIASVTSGTGGTAVLNANGTVTFTPNANFSGAASFTYTVSDGASTSSPATVTVNVAAVNDAPVAVADTLSATEDTAVTYTAAQLLGNDTDVDNSNAQLSIASVTSGTGGTAVLNANGTVTFTPNANFSGAASFTYTVSDGASTSSPATVTVNVAAVNDAPVITAASLAVAEGGTVLITPASIGVSDPDSSSFAFTVSNVTHGSFQTTTDGVTWTNATSFTTADLAASHVRFVHDGSLTAPTFSIQANDGAALNNLSNVFVGTVSFNNVNHAPVATPVTLAAGNEDTAYTISAATLLAGVTDVDGQPLSITAVSVASGGGSLVDNGNGTWTYTPAANSTVPVSFNYTASDGSLSASSTASLTLELRSMMPRWRRQ